MKMRALWERWKIFAEAIGTFQAKVILTALYIVFVGPVAVVYRLVADPLGLRRVPVRSYWAPRPSTDTTLASAQRQ